MLWWNPAREDETRWPRAAGTALRLLRPGAVHRPPIWGIDVWEQAYYLKYRNRRLQYVNSVWDVVNWREAAPRYEAGHS